MVLRSRIWRVLALISLLAPVLAACSSGVVHSGVKRSAFTSKEYGVAGFAAGDQDQVPQARGRAGDAAEALCGARRDLPANRGAGLCRARHGVVVRTGFPWPPHANGEIFGAYYLTAASPVLPIPSYARVTNLENGRSVMVRINDRGPYVWPGGSSTSATRRREFWAIEPRAALGWRSAMSGRRSSMWTTPRSLMASVNTPTQVRAAVADECDVAGFGAGVRMASVESGRVNLGDIQTRPSSRDPLSGGLIGDLIELFAYAGTEQAGDDVFGAVDAANAMATRSEALQGWVRFGRRGCPQDPAAIGDFRRCGRGGGGLRSAFAMLGAVDEEEFQLGDRTSPRD